VSRTATQIVAQQQRLLDTAAAKQFILGGFCFYFYEDVLITSQDYKKLEMNVVVPYSFHNVEILTVLNISHVARAR